MKYLDEYRDADCRDGLRAGRYFAGASEVRAATGGGRFEVENQDARSVRDEGNRAARDVLGKVFRIVPREWRGLGEIPASGLGLAPEYAAFDAGPKFALPDEAVGDDNGCLSGLVLQGRHPQAPPAGADDPPRFRHSRFASGARQRGPRRDGKTPRLHHRRLLEAGVPLHGLRDLTRGGLASALVELMLASGPSESIVGTRRIVDMLPDDPLPRIC